MMRLVAVKCPVRAIQARARRILIRKRVTRVPPEENNSIFRLKKVEG